MTVSEVLVRFVPIAIISSGYFVFRKPLCTQKTYSLLSTRLIGHWATANDQEIAILISGTVARTAVVGWRQNCPLFMPKPACHAVAAYLLSWSFHALFQLPLEKKPSPFWNVKGTPSFHRKRILGIILRPEYDFSSRFSVQSYLFISRKSLSNLQTFITRQTW